MAELLRVGRGGVGATVTAALVVQYFAASDRAAFTTANFFSYFTVLSNVIAAAVLLTLAVAPRLHRTTASPSGAVRRRSTCV